MGLAKERIIRAKPSLVLVPGMLCDARLFSPQLTALADCVDIIVADCSQSDSITGMAEQLLAAVPSHSFVLAGLSMGGIVAMETFRLAPERITALGLMATNHKPAKSDFIAIRSEQIIRAHNGGLRDIVIQEMKSHYLGPPHSNDATLRDLIVDMAIQFGPAVFERQARALINRSDQSDTLRHCHVPVKLLAGAHDELCPPANHLAMKNLVAHAEMHVLSSAGHLLTLEAPADISMHLRELIERTH